jgi:succinate dehydrogenase / fumarate reductase flavoprotein subunit
MALDMRNIMLMARCVAAAALERQESRGGHTRDDYPGMRPDWRKLILACGLDGNEITIARQPTPSMRPDLLALFDVGELKKYMTDEELAGLPAAAPATTAGASATATEEKH